MTSRSRAGSCDRQRPAQPGASHWQAAERQQVTSHSGHVADAAAELESTHSTGDFVRVLEYRWCTSIPARLGVGKQATLTSWPGRGLTCCSAAPKTRPRLHCRYSASYSALRLRLEALPAFIVSDPGPAATLGSQPRAQPWPESQAASCGGPQGHVSSRISRLLQAADAAGPSN